MIKDGELRNFMDQVMVRGDNLELYQVMQAIKMCADDFGIPIDYEPDEVKSGGILSSTTEPCYVVYHPEHRKDYYKICVRLRKQGKVGFIMINDFGKSRLEANQASHDMTSQAVKDAIFNGGNASYAVGAVIGSAARKIVRGGSNKTKLEEEQQYYTVLMGVFQEFSPYLDEIHGNRKISDNSEYSSPNHSQSVVEPATSINMPVAEKRQEVFDEPVENVTENIKMQKQESDDITGTDSEPNIETKSTLTLEELMVEMDFTQNVFDTTVNKDNNLSSAQLFSINESGITDEKNKSNSDSKRCPKCNTTQLLGNFCPVCGSALESLINYDADIISENTTYNQDFSSTSTTVIGDIDSMNQPEADINSELHYDSTFSRDTLGTNSTNVWTDSQDEPEKPNGLVFALIGVIVILFAAIIIVLFGMISSNKQGETVSQETNKNATELLSDAKEGNIPTGDTSTTTAVMEKHNPQTQIQYSGMEGTIQNLLDKNFEFIEFYQIGMLDYGKYVSSLNLYVVNDSKMNTWGQFKSYVSSLYANKRASEIITTDNKYWGPDGDSGSLYIFPSNFSLSNYNITWDIYTIEITSQNSSACSFKVVDVETDYSVDGKAVYENGKWLLEKEVY